MHVSLSEKDAEIIRLNLVLGDERKRNNDMAKYHDMPLQITPRQSMSRSSSRVSIVPEPVFRTMHIDSPYFQKTIPTSHADT